MNDRSDRDGLDGRGLSAEAMAEVDAWCRGATPPGLADVVARATAMGEPPLSAEDLKEARRLDGLDDDTIAAGVRFGTLEDFLDDAAAFAMAQAVTSVPPMPQPAAPPAAGVATTSANPTRRRGVVVAIAAVLSAAAALVLLPRFVDSSWILGDDVGGDGRSGYASAIDRVDVDESAGVARTRTPSKKQVSAEPTAPDEAVPIEEVEAIEPQPVDAPEPSVAVPRTNGRDKAKVSRRDRIAAMDADARAAWKRGDLGAAQRGLERVVRAAGRQRIADVAYGDLFTLARQQGDTGTLRRYWRKYAGKFPKGRYIDDARAGLCRTAATTQQRACWEAYLRDRPHGTYHAHARDAVSRGE